MTDGRDLPWLQDIDADEDGRSDNFLNRWDYAYRDVVIVDSANHPVEAFNLTQNDLSVPSNFETLKQKLIAAADTDVVETWTNPVDPLDVNGDSAISPLDALLIYNELNGPGARELEPIHDQKSPPPFLDPTADGFVSPLDALLVINRLNEINTVQTLPAVSVSPELIKINSTTTSDSNSLLLAAAVDDIFFDNWDDNRSKRVTVRNDLSAT